MIHSVLRAIKIIEALTRFGKATPLKDVASAVGLSKVTTYRLLQSLCEGRLVQNIGDSGLYALGPACLAFAEAFQKSFTMRDRVLPYLEKLVNVIGETAIYCERYGLDSCVTVERWDSPHDTRTFSGTGIMRPLTAGSSALAILAMLSKREIAAILSSDRVVQHTPFSPLGRKGVLKKVEDIKTRGYAVSMRERDLDTGGIAAPVFRDKGVVGSLAVIGPVDRMRRNGIQRIGKQVHRIAGELSSELQGKAADFQKELKGRAR